MLVSRVKCCPWVVVAEVLAEVVEEIVEDPWSTKPPKSKRVGLWKRGKFAPLACLAAWFGFFLLVLFISWIVSIVGPCFMLATHVTTE